MTSCGLSATLSWRNVALIVRAFFHTTLLLRLFRVLGEQTLTARLKTYEHRLSRSKTWNGTFGVQCRMEVRAMSFDITNRAIRGHISRQKWHRSKITSRSF